MTTITRRKFRVSRQMKASLWGSQKDPVHKRNYGPGQHGRAPVKKISDFYKQNAAQRAFRTYYVIGKKQFANIFGKAYRGKGNTNDNLISLLEKRISSVLYRSGMVPTIFAARQLVSHKHVTVNGSVVNICSFTLREGDTIQIRERAANIPCVVSALGSNIDCPHYLELNKEKRMVKLLVSPKLADVPYPVVMEPNLVTEYFSSKM